MPSPSSIGARKPDATTMAGAQTQQEVPGTGPEQLPEGTLTLLFSDVEGSTALLARLGERYAEVVSLQRRIQRSAFARHGGHEMGTEGDSFFVVFATAGAAVAAALDAQRELGATAWPEGARVRVRMGLHTGEPVRHEDGYVGMDVHRAARVAAAAHGGQVLLTEATCRLATGQVSADFTDLGEHRLKDLPGNERLYQLRADGLATTFPAPKTLGSGATVPQFPTTLVGRARERAQVGGQLLDPAGRLVTLTGPGGVGKTRLAMAVATDLSGHLADGVYFVPLASARGDEVMWSSLADALGVNEEARTPLALLDYLAGREVLLVLDNLEQLDGAPSMVDQIVRTCPRARVLATSRRPLHVVGEHQHPLAPLPLPGPDAGPAEAAACDAVDLFVQRARLVRPGFTLTAENVGDVVAVCQQLDGLPLAIELVAARARLLGPRAMRARVEQGLELAGTSLGLPDRQRTLRAAIAWSHDLLPPPLQAVFRQVSVFEGEFDLDAVAAVVDDDADPLDLVGELVDANLALVREGPDGEPRVRVLRTIARFGRERLAEHGETDAVRRRHARHFLAVAEGVRPQLRSAAHLAGRDRLAGSLADLRAALAWSLGTDQGAEPADLATGLRLCEQLFWFWYACGYQPEGRRWLGAAVAAAAGTEGPELMAALHGLAVLVLQHGEPERAREMLTRTLDHQRRTGSPSDVASELSSLAMANRALGESGRARDLLEEAIGLARGAGERAHLASALSNLAALEIDAGRHDRSLALLTETLAIDHDLGDTWGTAADHVNIATALLRAGRLEEVAQTLAEHGPAVVALGDVELTVDVLEIACALAARRGEARRAARLLGAAGAMRRRAEFAMTAPDEAYLQEQVELVRNGSDAARWAQDLQDGARLDVEEAAREAVGGSAVG
ncbi:ATP-binding protein [Georgenia subflava]|uniref:Guanylate cyclase domain-containing protein n=1 Tax=Georgenia subflava TaxID=1622177 RepID=A0A6N7EQC3_9MICO|nr:adenylate/guanylate cyclase domain-containing protein [Georgenia subflava]MPV37404.1 hypothetical protein [Georgenia subflava]